MKQWFLSRSPEERLALIAGSVVLLLLIAYLLVWRPVGQDLEKTRTQIREQRADVAWMRPASQEAKALQQGGSATAASGGETLITIVDRTARGSGLREVIQRLKPDGNDSVELWLESAPFDAMMHWLGTLQQSQGVRIDSVSVDSRAETGLVNARLSMKRTTS